MRRPRVITGLFLLAVLLPAVVLLAAARGRWAAMQDAAEQETLGTVALLEQHARHLLETQDLVLDLVEDMVRGADDAAIRAADTSARLRALAARLPQTVSIWVSDADGAVVASSIPPPPGVSVAETDYFVAQRAADMPNFMSAPYVGRVTRQPSFAMSRRRPAADGGFAGVLHVAISPAAFSDVFRLAQRGRPGAASLIRDDGVIILREPPAGTARRLDPTSPLLRAVATEPEQGLLRDVSSLDGMPRLYAYRRIAPFPVYVGYGLDMPQRVAEWRADVARDSVVALLAMLLLGTAAWLARRAVLAREATLAALRAETERRVEIQASLGKARALESLGRMARGVAHDFNNLLTVVLGNLETLEETLPDPAQRATATRARHAAEAGAQLAGSLLAYARTQVLHVEPVAVGPLVVAMRPVLQDMAGPRVALRLDIPPGLPACRCDPAQLRAALGNLVANARDAMPPEGGHIVVAARTARFGAADLAGSGAEPGEFVSVSVTDDGAGMTAEVAAQAFEPFFTTKSAGRGSGLGLAHVEGLLVQLGGRVRLESAPGRGTTVTLDLPATDEPAAAEPPPPPEAAAAGPARRRVLVVDDEPEIAALTRRMLAGAGYEATVAADAREALALVAAGARFDLLLSDVVMPGGPDGASLLRTLRARDPGLAAVLMSGYAPDVAALQAAGAGFLGKPFTRRALLDAVQQALATPR
jgi:signal transduction histidine kinase